MKRISARHIPSILQFIFSSGSKPIILATLLLLLLLLLLFIIIIIIIIMLARLYRCAKTYVLPVVVVDLCPQAWSQAIVYQDSSGTNRERSHITDQFVGYILPCLPGAKYE